MYAGLSQSHLRSPSVSAAWACSNNALSMSRSRFAITHASFTLAGFDGGAAGKAAASSNAFRSETAASALDFAAWSGEAVLLL